MDTPPQARPILVALGSEAQSLRLIHAGFRLAQDRSAPWIGVYVDTGQGAAKDDAEQVQVWMQEAQRLGAEVRSVEAPTLAQGLSDLTRRTHAQALVMGRSRDHWPWVRLGHSTADELQRRGLDAEIVILDDRSPSTEDDASGIRLSAMAGTFLVLATSTGLAWLMPREGNLSLVLPVYLVGVIIIGHQWGAAFGILASVLSVLLYNFLLETPRFRLAGQHWPNLL
ncbi:MAG: DUF4118 domain-containing protein, partial [Desulfobaccales bacterium]